MTAPPATPTVRSELAGALRAALDPAGVNVYSAPPDVVAVPAVVIAPGSPYRREHAYSNVAHGFDLLLLVQRATDPAASLDVLDALIDAVRGVVLELPAATWGEVGSVGETLPIGGISYLSAQCRTELLREA